MPYRPSPRQLEYLIAVADTGHFGEAAKLCHVSQPTLSVQLALLEEQLGAALIDRTRGRVAPTHLGQRIIETARSILNGLDNITALAKTSRTNLGGLIRFGVVPTFGPYFLPHFLPSLHARYPDLQVYVREDRPLTLEAEVENGTTDCALGPQPFPSDSFAFRPICTEQIFLGVPLKHPLARQETVDAKMLAGEKLLTLGRGHRLLDNVRELSELAGAHLAEDYEGTSLDALRQMVSIEMGLSLFPELYAKSEFARDTNVKLVEISGWNASRTIGVIWRKGSVRESHFEELAALAADLAVGVLGRDDL
jgi:LysR family transcriptional regulator, hydrogen peroxide-inducible genes activator